jgi:bifunctional non-homologous end joining protein LigD
MLASTGPITAPATDWAFEPKLDGWRVLVYIDSGLIVRTRNGHDIAVAVPELAPMAEALAGRAVVLDGELVARQGRPWEFYRLGARLGARSSIATARGRVRTPVTFAAFDVLALDGEVVTRLPWVERRALLDDLGLQGPAWCTVSSFAGLGTNLFVACAELGLEGLVAKRLSSVYQPGTRSKDWVKAKCPDGRADRAPRRDEHGGDSAATGARRARPTRCEILGGVPVSEVSDHAVVVADFTLDGQ